MELTEIATRGMNVSVSHNNYMVHTSFGEIRTTSPKPAVKINLVIRGLGSLTIFLVELYP
jgi:hypothetical protein